MSAFRELATRIAQQDLPSEDLYSEGVADVIVAGAEENERLRAALKEIASVEPKSWTTRRAESALALEQCARKSEG